MKTVPAFIDTAIDVPALRRLVDGPRFQRAADHVIDQVGVLGINEDRFYGAMTLIGADDKSADELAHQAALERLDVLKVPTTLTDQLESGLASSQSDRFRLGYLLGLAVGRRQLAALPTDTRGADRGRRRRRFCNRQHGAAT